VIISSIPTNLLIPGAFSQLEKRSIAESSIPVENRVVIVAEKLASGTAVADTPYNISNDVESDVRFGAGSMAAILCRKAREQGLFGGNIPKISCVGVVEPGGAKATRTLTCTLVSPKAGNFRMTIGRHQIVVGVSTTDVQNTFAANLKAEIDKINLVCPITATVAANVVTCTFTTNGENGNDLVYAITDSPSNVTVVSAVGTPGSGVAAIANGLASLYDRNYDAVALANHKAADITSALVDLATAWAPGTENFRFYFIGETGSIGTVQALATAANDERIFTISMEQGLFLPGELAVSTAIAAFSKDKPNASLNNEVLQLPTCAPAFAYTGGPSGEQQALLVAGVTPMVPDGSGFIKIVRLISTIKTVDGIPYAKTRDLAFPRTQAWLARQIAYRYILLFKQRNQDQEYFTEVREMVLSAHRNAEKLGYLRDVESLADQIVVEPSIDEGTRAMVSAPFFVAGPAHQVFAKHVMLMA
jgi:phage tail sheath gpL-like